MEKLHDDLEAPVLLIALPQVRDPYFHRSVVLLLSHGAEGSFGFIINRPTGIHISEILQGMSISWGGPSDVLAYFGGPVQPQLGSVVFIPTSEGQVEESHATEALPGVWVTQQITDLEGLAVDPPASLRLFLGYAGWGSEQLMQEILRNDWLTAPVQQELIFARDAATVWQDALRSVGIDPASLPSWTVAQVGDQDAN